MNTNVYFIIHCIIAIAALAMLGVAFFQSLVRRSLVFGGANVSYDIYMTHSCVSMDGQSECSDLSPVFKPQMQAIMGIVITLMACIFLQFISMNFSGVISNIFGLLVLVLSIVLIILISLLSFFTINGKKYNLTGTSIGVIVVTCLLVVFELCCNKLVQRGISAPYHLITGKKV
jgi:hypothetical protein